MSVLGEAVALPRIALLKVWEWEGFGQPDAVIGANDYWLSPDAADRLDDGVRASLEERELAVGGHLVPELRDTLRVLAQGRDRYFGWVNDVAGGTTCGVLVVAHGDEAVRLVRDEDYVGIERIYAEQLAEYMVDALPYLHPAPIEPLTVARSELGDDLDDGYPVLVSESPDGPSPVAEVRRLLGRERSGAHQLYAARRDAAGRDLISAPLTALDLTDSGRVLSVLDTSPDDEPLVRCVPGDWDTMVHELQRAAHELR